MALNLTTASNIFKTKYGKISKAHYNTSQPLLSQVKKTYKFVGAKLEYPVETTYKGSVASGPTPPRANTSNPEMLTATRKTVFARAQILDEAIVASKGDEAAFVDALKYEIKKTVESYDRNMERILHGDGTGLLGLAASGTVVGSVVTVVISADSWVAANFEVNDYININSSTVNVFEITAIDDATRTITMQLVAGSAPASIVADDELYTQLSKDNEPMGLKGAILDTADGTKTSLYGISVGRRWKGVVVDAAGAVSADLINQVILTIHQDVGQSPNLCLASYKQYRKIMALSENQKSYEMAGPMKSRDNPEVKLLFASISLMTPSGPIRVVLDRFVKDDTIYLVNTDYIEVAHAPNFGWLDRDNTVFLREADSYNYEAKYGGYMECIIHPPFQGALIGLT